MTHVYDNYLYLINEPMTFKKWEEEKNRKKKDKKQEWIKDQFIKPLSNIFSKPGGNQAQFRSFYPQFDKINSSFPRNSVRIRIEFTLKKPYFSKDDGIFYVKGDKFHENTIVRDKLTDNPMVRSTAWKGNLRFAAGKIKTVSNKNKIIDRLFGTQVNRGRLHFFPTFFDFKQGDKSKPVKEGSRGELHLFYFPYPKGSNYSCDEVGQDLALLAKSLALMLYTHGFGAKKKKKKKKSSGYGVVNKLQDDQIEVFPEQFEEYFKVLCNDQNGAGGGGPDNK